MRGGVGCRQKGVNLFSELYYVQSCLVIHNIKPLNPLSVRKYSSYTRYSAEDKFICRQELFVYRKIHNGAIVNKRNEIHLGPKFLHNKFKSYHLLSSIQTSHDFIAGCCCAAAGAAGCTWSKHRLPVIIRRQLQNKAKLAFILPNYDAAKRIGPHNKDVISLLVGTLLGDCHAEREKSGGVRFRFKQSERHKDYIFWLQEFFYKRGYCSNNLPVLFKDGPKLQYKCYRFSTFRYTSLLWLYKLFYGHSKQKKVPKNIADFLTPLSLAVWIFDDGGFHNSGVRLHTNCFTREEVMLLSLALNTKFNIKSTLHKNQDNFVIYIVAESMPRLKKLLKPYLIPSMYYKLGL